MAPKLPVVKTKPPPAPPPPAQSKTQDNYTHHTSPVAGPQAVAPDVVTAQKPGAKTSITKLPPAPQAKYKHEK